MGASMGSATGQMANFSAQQPDAFAQQTTATPPATGANPNPAPVQQGAPMTYQPMGKGGSSGAGGKGGSSITFPSTSGQPQMGVPNSYANTIQSGDNSVTPQPIGQRKGKGS